MLVVCEVKTRRARRSGSPLEAVTALKARAAAEAGGGWLPRAGAPGRGPDRPGRGAAAGRAGRRRRARRGGGLMPLARARGGGAGRRRRPPGRGRGRPRRRRAVVQPGRAAGRVAGRVARPGPGRGGEQRAALAARRITVDLSPATLPKRGSQLRPAHRRGDPGRAGVVPPHAFDDAVLLGELGLDGRGPRRSAACCRRSPRRPGPASRPPWCRRPTRRRRRWCRACG